MTNKAKIFLKIVLGCVLYALGISVFLQPNLIAPGGFSGIAVILNHITQIKTGTIMLILNIPVAVIGYKKLGKEFMGKTIFCVILSSIFMNIFTIFIDFEVEPLIASIYGGILIGAGIGLCFSVDSSTGGTDIITRIIRNYKPHLSLGQIMILLDIIVIILGVFVFKDINVALYAIITIYISSKLIDSVIEGPDLAKLIYIISNYNEEISLQINEKLKRGSTILYGKGAYTKTTKQVLICAVKRQQIPKIKEIASAIDRECFVIVTDVREVLGYGFKTNKEI